MQPLLFSLLPVSSSLLCVFLLSFLFAAVIFELLGGKRILPFGAFFTQMAATF